MATLNIPVTAEFGNFTFEPLSDARYFRVEFRDGVEVYRHKYNYVTMEVSLDEHEKIWKVQSTYGALTPAAQKFLVNLVENWANTWANEPQYRSRRSEQAARYRSIDLSAAQNDLNRARKTLEACANEVMRITRDIMEGKECPHCGCFITPDQQKEIWEDDYPHADAPLCPHCNGLLPDNLLKSFLGWEWRN